MASRRKRATPEAEASEKPPESVEKQPDSPVTPLDLGVTIALGVVRSYLESNAKVAFEFGLSAAVIGAKKLGLSLADVRKRTGDLWENEEKLKL